MSTLTIATAAVSVAGMIVSQGRRVLVLPEGSVDASLVAACNLLLSAADVE